jgi:hypothetical protein
VINDIPSGNYLACIYELFQQTSNLHVDTSVCIVVSYDTGDLPAEFARPQFEFVYHVPIRLKVIWGSPTCSATGLRGSVNLRVNSDRV